MKVPHYFPPTSTFFLLLPLLRTKLCFLFGMYSSAKLIFWLISNRVPRRRRFLKGFSFSRFSPFLNMKSGGFGNFFPFRCGNSSGGGCFELDKVVVREWGVRETLPARLGVSTLHFSKRCLFGVLPRHRDHPCDSSFVLPFTHLTVIYVGLWFFTRRVNISLGYCYQRVFLPLCFLIGCSLSADSVEYPRGGDTVRLDFQ